MDSTRSQVQPKEPMETGELATRMWQIVRTDICHFETRNYLVTVDYFSNFSEVDHLEELTSNSLIRALKAHFARYGVPEILRSDNGPQFTSEAFEKFTIKWQFRHVTSSPRYPQSNGKVENTVKTVKDLMAKARPARTDPWLAALIWRNIPSQGLDSSPVQRLMGRHTNTVILPTSSSLLEPTVVEDAKQKMQKLKEQQKTYYDRGAEALEPLQNECTVYVQPTDGRVWKRGTVVRKTRSREYEVELDGHVHRRNRQHLRQIPEQKLS